MSDTDQRRAESRSRMIETLERTQATIIDVIRQNEVLAEDQDHRESALQRAGEGRAELERVTAELANLRAGRALGSS
jgi:hypothetical protein